MELGVQIFTQFPDTLSSKLTQVIFGLALLLLTETTVGNSKYIQFLEKLTSCDQISTFEKLGRSVPRLQKSTPDIKVAEPYVKNLKSYLKIVYRSDSFKISSSSIILLLPTAVFMCTVATRDQK